MIINLIILFCSVLIGTLAAYFFSQKINIKNLLIFSGAFFLSLIILKILPNLFSNSNNGEYIGLFIILGIFLQLILENFSQGIEHGHLGIRQKSNINEIILISLSIHSFVEGLSIGYNDFIYLGVIIHKLPISFILASFLFKQNIKKRKVYVYLFLFSLMTPLGSLCSSYSSLLMTYQFEILAVSTGLLFHISNVIILESTHKHTFKLKTFILLSFGFFLATLL